MKRYQEWFASKAGFFKAAEEGDLETIYRMFKARMIDEMINPPTESDGYDFIAGAEIKKNDFVYISENGKVYPYRKLSRHTKEDEIIVDGEPTYPKDIFGLNN